MLVYGNALSALIGAPLTVLFFIWQTEISLSNIHVVLVPGAAVMAVVTVLTYLWYQFLLAPFRWYFTSREKGTDFGEKQALIVKERITNISVLYSLGLIGQWIIGLLTFSIVSALLYGLTFDQLLYLWVGGIISISVSVMAGSFFIPRTINRIVEKGVFNNIINVISTRPVTWFGSLVPVITSSNSIVSILLVFLLTASGILLAHNLIEDLYETNVKTLTGQVSENLDNTFNEAFEDMELISQLSSPSESARRLRSLKPEYNDILIIENGNIISSLTGQYNSLIRKSWNNLELEKSGNNVVSKPVIDKKRNNSYVIAGHRLGNRLYAVIFQAKQLRELILDEVVIGQSGYIFVGYQDGDGLVHPKMDITVKSIFDYDWGKSLYKNAGTFIPYLFQGEHKIGYLENTNTGFILIATFPRSELNMYSKKLAIITVLIGLLWSIFAAAIIYRNVRRLLSPLQEAREVISNIANGDLTSRMDIARGDEVGILSSAVNILTNELREAISGIYGISDQLASSSSHMSMAISSFSENVQNEASTVEEISATIEEISAGMENVARRADSQNESLVSLISLLKNLSETIQKVADTMNVSIEQVDMITRKSSEGSQSLNQMNNTMKVLAKSSDDMKNIIQIINDISEQINLLSLNAAIEAARAGDFGRGFAVVSDEISKLADQTAQSIKEIDNLIMQNSTEMSKGTVTIEQSIQTFGIIIQGVEHVSGRMQQVATEMNEQLSLNTRVQKMITEVQAGSEEIKNATGEQRAAVSEISTSIGSINELAQTNAGAAEEMSANASNVEDLAVKLKDMVSFFKTKA